MGQRSATETVIALVQAFLEERTWTQAALARRLEMTVPAVRRRLEEMRGAGFPLESEADHPHVYWSVPKDWFPGGLLIKREEVPELLRLLGRMGKSKAREKLLSAIVARIPVEAMSTRGVIVAPNVSAREAEYLDTIEDAASTKTVLRFHYYSTSRGIEGGRLASVHRVNTSPPARFVATCHRSGQLKWFRVENVSDAKLDPREPFRDATAEQIDAYIAGSVDGYREQDGEETLSFFVREPESRWVAQNLPSGMVVSVERGGIRVNVASSALLQAAREVVKLGGAATPESPALASKVIEIAEAALRNARPSIG